VESPGAAERIGELQKLFDTKLRRADIYTGLGDSVAAYAIGSFFHGTGRPTPLEPGTQAKWADLVNNNLIIVASLGFYNLRQELQFPTEFQLSPQGAKIDILHPKAGEQSEYAGAVGPDESGADYALISVWSGTAPDRRLMTVGGLHTWGTAGAAHFVTNPALLRSVAPKLRADMGPSDAIKGLQVLIRVQVKGGQPIGEEYVAHRWLL
jgi:hypothetical protein